MKTLRDILIVVVLGGVVMYAVFSFLSKVQSATVAQSPVVANAEIACIEDGIMCHAGYDQFSSVEDAQAYLDGPEHYAAEMKRKTEADLKAQATELAKHGLAKVRAACVALHTISCAGFSKDLLDFEAEQVVTERARLAEQSSRKLNLPKSEP